MTRVRGLAVPVVLVLSAALAFGVGLAAWRESSAALIALAATAPILALACALVFAADRSRKLRRGDERYRSVFQRSFDAVYLHDREGKFLDANEATLQLFGYTREELTDLTVYDLLDEAEQRATQTRIANIVEDGYGAPRNLKAKRKDETIVYLVVTASLIENERGEPVVLGIAHDVSERVRAEEVLRGSEEKYRQIYQSAQDIFYRTDARGIISEIGPAVQRWGYTQQELIGTQVLDVYVRPEERSGLLNELMSKGEVSDYEVVLKAEDGHLVNASVGSHLILDENGNVIGVEGVLRDITERKKAEQALREQMHRDPLTGVLNHLAIVAELRRVVGEKGNGGPVAVIMSDIDNLKAINETLGHAAGDRILVEVAKALSNDGALVGRYGSDEFIVILPGGRAEAKRYEKRVVASLSQRLMRETETGARLPVRISLGTAIFPIEASRVEELIELADSAMFASKRQHGQASSTPVSSRGEDSNAVRIVGEIVPFLTAAGDLDEKLRLVAHRLSVTAGYDAVSFSLFEHGSGGSPAVSTFAHLPERLLERWNEEAGRARTAETSIRKLLQAGRPVLMDDPRGNDHLTESEQQMLRKAGLKSALVAPMLWRGDLIGALSVASKTEGALGPRDAQLLGAIATQVTAIVSLETLVEKLRSASGRLSLAHQETVMLLAAAAEAHDRTTGEHLQNVRAITEELALELGYDEESARKIGLAAVLHDMGKIRVPDSVLANTGRLTEAEWELMRHHAVWGEQFLAGRTGFELAASIARSHHERWDGGGYPDGLGGEEIPWPAAIVAVADSFDAITSDRPYRPGRSVAAALQEIQACSGTQFSPKVVDAIMRLHERGKVLSPRRIEVEEQAA